ncbi:DUF2793 domain-containing protein [Rubrimonas cliftonensis]|uniref:Uncharacterized protein n=1 Tax=Rubrimonas cliftonensis TaxID=89524 RepID=A0A1H3ZHM7_9RHOB|nr:DUF2793 domain-containing protein [Rubrimonas cliftonensis]SEA22784.1 Protein of unknown function [Rubrimonas cliftonensis]
MSDTRRLGLTLLEAGQAQKHVTVNAALTRLEGFSAATALSRTLAAAPPALEGDLYIPADGASGAWAGHDGRLALFDNGGWVFADAELGRRLFVADEAAEVVHDGDGWAAATGEGAFGAGASLRAATLDHAVTGGVVSLTATFIPDKAIVLGVTARVIAPLEGPGLTGWRLGVEGSPDRYGSGYGVGLNAHAAGVTGAPVAYYGPTALLLAAEGGAFERGVVRLCAHLLTLTPPRPV